MQISQRMISRNHPPYIIAELGVNHDGSVDRALALTRLAAAAGADAIKLQLFEADRLMSRASRLASYQRAAGERDPVTMLRRLELSVDGMRPVVALAHELGLHAVVTVFSLELAPLAEQLEWDAYKSASPDIINRPLLEAIGATGRPLIVSTGASTLEEVARAAGWLSPHAGRLALLQCVSSYPTAEHDANLAAMADLRRVFGGPVGYSDHTPDVDTGALASAMGAEILEKHLTDDRAAKGPDHAASLDGDSFARYVRLAREARARGGAARPVAIGDPRIGDGRKRVLACEQDVRTVSRQSLVAARSLPIGHTITRQDLTVKRPGNGVPPYELESTIGRVLARAVEADTPLEAAMLLAPRPRALQPTP